MKQLGVNLIGSDTSNGITWGAISDTLMGLGKPLSDSQLSIGTSVLTAYINAMEQAGVMKTLAEPTFGGKGDVPGRRRIQPSHRSGGRQGRQDEE